MPEADTFEAPQGKTFHAEPLLQSITEAFVGNGVLANGDAEVTADGSTAMGIDVAAASTGISYGGQTYSPSADSFTLSTGPTTTTNSQDDRRVDLVYFEPGSGYAVAEGTADPNPVPPSVPSGALMLAVILIPHEASDLADPNILNWRARPSGGQTGGSTGTGAGAQEVEFSQGLHVGFDPGTDITETSSPTGFTFTAGDGRDIHKQADVTISNNSGASATEDVTVTLYDGTSSGGTQLVTDTQSVSLADGASTTDTFIPTDQNLDGGDYFVEVTTSGSDLAIDQTVERTQGLVYSYTETDDGRLQLTNRYTGTVVQEVNPLTDQISWPNAAIEQAEIADGSIVTSKLADDAVTAAKIAADAVTSEQIADDAVDDARIGDLAAGIASVTNPGTFGALFDVPVDSNSPDGTLHSYSFAIDDNDLFTVRATSTGSGGVDNFEVRYSAPIDVNGNNIEDGSTVVYSTSEGHVPRPQVDDQIVRSSTKTSAYTTTDEEMVPVDASGTGGLTITLATADAAEGNEIIIKDVGGNASLNPITVATEGSETIDGATDATIDVNYGVLVVVGDGTNWDIRKEPARTVDPRNIFEGTETGAVANGDQGILTVDNLADGESVDIFKAALTTDTIQAIPTDVDLKLVTFDNAGSFTTRSTLIAGDGSTIHDRETGNPLASYENTSGSPVSVGVVVDNQSGSSQDVVAKVEGTAPA